MIGSEEDRTAVETGGAPPPEAGYLGEGRRASFAVLHLSARPPTVGLVLSPPFGWEQQAAHRSLATWAAGCADAGVPVVRPDLPATGDAAGDVGDEGLVDAWVDGVLEGARLLRARSGCERVAVVGIGLGGLIGALAASRDRVVDDLVLWATPTTGRSLIRELGAFSRLSGASSGQPRSADLVAAGYRMAPETQAAISGIDLRRLSLHGTEERRVLFITRDGRAPAPSADRPFEGAAAEEITGHGLGLLLGDPATSRFPEAVSDAVLGWCRRAPTARLHCGVPRPTPRWSPQVNLIDAVERPLLLGSGVAGILTSPAAPSGNLTVVFLNAGAQRRTGPNRMWVEAARRFAANGITSVRLDLPGIGESPGVEPRTDHDFCTGLWHHSVRLAMDELIGRHGVPGNIMLAGLCSGAYWGMQAASKDARVRACVLLNPRTLCWHEELEASRGAHRLRTRALSLTSWKRLLRGGYKVPDLVAAVQSAEWVGVGRARRRPDMLASALAAGAASIKSLAADGTSVALLFTPNEPLHRELEAGGLLTGLAGTEGVRVIELDGPVDIHTLNPLATQRQVHGVLDAAAAHELERQAAALQLGALGGRRAGDG